MWKPAGQKTRTKLRRSSVEPKTVNSRYRILCDVSECAVAKRDRGSLVTLHNYFERKDHRRKTAEQAHHRILNEEDRLLWHDHLSNAFSPACAPLGRRISVTTRVRCATGSICRASTSVTSWLADVQAFSTHFDDPRRIVDSVYEMVLDWLAVGLDPTKQSNIFFVLQGRFRI